MTATKRGVNLGCGTLTMPRAEKPLQHDPVPDAVYLDPAIQWDNVDRNPAPNVSHLENLFAYPWALETGAYDVALVSHLAEHIPHEICWNGRDWGHLTLDRAPQSIRDQIAYFGGVVLPHGSHPGYQSGWYAWFSELWRIMKPGGKAYIMVPFAFSNGAVAEPTHTRYCIPATFNYFNPSDDFMTPMGQQWKVEWESIRFQPHEMGMRHAEAHLLPGANAATLIEGHMMRYVNVMFAFMAVLEAVKDAESDTRPAQRGTADPTQPAVSAAGSVATVADRILQPGAAD